MKSKCPYVLNPASNGKFTIVLPEITGNATIGIFDNQGRVLYQKDADSNKKLELHQHLNAGVYLITIKTNKLNVARKLIVNWRNRAME